MRVLFIVMRAVGYGAVLSSLMFGTERYSWWQWAVSLFFVCFGIWDYEKKPDASAKVLQRGVLVEFVCLVVWSLLLQNGQPLFLLLSPLLRSCVHLRMRDSAMALIAALLLLSLFALLFSFQPSWAFWIAVGAIVVMGAYGLVIGAMVRQRDRIRRMTLLSLFEREQQVKAAERVRMADQLHDVMGQYWTAVIRALDVAGSVQDERQQIFVQHARNAAMQGLLEMRQAVHEWHGGLQTPAQWMQEVEQAVRRFAEWGGVQIHFSCPDVDWRQFTEGERAAEAVARTLLEGLTNAVRHGHASSVTLQVRTDRDHLQASVVDNGFGLSGQAAAAAEGIGLFTIKKLAEELRGTLEVQSQGGGGTSVTLEIPFRKGAL